MSVQTASIHDYKSGSKYGDGDVDLAQYDLWKEGPSEVCAASRCISASELERLSIPADTTIFVIEK
jgi:hypothetical protein